MIAETQTETKTELPACVQRALDTLDNEAATIAKRREKVLALTAEVERVIEVLAPFVEQAGKDGPCREIEIQLSEYGWTPISVAVWKVRDLRSMVPLLEACHDAGYRAVNTQDSDDALWRTYRREGLTVTAFLAKDAVCRRVQVGTKIVPVYEIRCEKRTGDIIGDEATA